MYDFIKGKLIERNPAYAVIEANGVGYLMNISLHTYSLMKEEDHCQLYAHLAVREDAMVLFGFFEKEERELFRQLISVSGVGTNTARMILSSLSPDEVSQAIIREDSVLLQKIKGIGLKTAQRIIIDLKDKLYKELIPREKIGIQHNTKREEALSGLLILGFQKVMAEKALNKVIDVEGPALSVEQMIRNALKIL